VKYFVGDGGGRGHTLVRQFLLDPNAEQVFWAGANAASTTDPRIVPVNVDPNNIEGLVRLAVDEMIDLTAIGPEKPLVEGIVTAFEKEGRRIFGVGPDAALLEGSKKFACEFRRRNNIASAEFAVFTDPEEAIAYVRMKGAPIVVKADGLCGGKGVKVALDLQTAIQAIREAEENFGDAAKTIVIEEYLEGEEATVMLFVSGRKYVKMPASQDHKAIFDNDEGPNTGGTGAYSPAPVITDEMDQRIEQEIIIPTVNALADEGIDYRGVLYIGLMITNQGPKVLEYNVRFGDPEAEVVIPKLVKPSLADIMEACIDGQLDQIAPHVEWDPRPMVGVVLMSEGYPGPIEKEKLITGLEQAMAVPDGIVFHAGTMLGDNDVVLTSSGRVIIATAFGKDIPDAIERAYQIAALIEFDGKYNRTDIGKKALKYL